MSTHNLICFLGETRKYQHLLFENLRKKKKKKKNVLFGAKTRIQFCALIDSAINCSFKMN